MYHFKVNDSAFLPHCGCEVEINFDKGSIVSLLGENGIGKTTLLKAISKVQARDGVYVEQKNPDSFFDRSLGKMKELYLLAAADSLHRKRFSDLWEGFRLSGKETRMLSSLSGGEGQMLKLCFALSLERDLYLLDEPSQNLDSQSKMVLCKSLKELVRENKSILMVEHQLEWDVLPIEIIRLHVVDTVLRRIP